MYRKAKVKLLKLLDFFLARRLLFIKVKKGERKKKNGEGIREMSEMYEVCRSRGCGLWRW